MYYLIHRATTKRRDVKKDILKTQQMYQNWDAKNIYMNQKAKKIKQEIINSEYSKNK